MNKYTSLRSYIESAKNEEAKELINELGIEADLDGGTPLMYAVLYQNREIFDHLIDTGANINTTYENGYTPLIAASELRNLDMVSILLDNGADVNATDKQGNSAVIKSASSKKNGYEIMEVLLKHNADFNSKNSYGESAYDLVKRLNNEKKMELIEQYLK